MNVFSWEFVSLAIIVFAVFMVLLGLFAAYFGKGKNRTYGCIIAVVGLVITACYGYLMYDGPIDSIKAIAGWELIREALVNLLAVGIGAIVAIAIFLVAVLKN